MAEYQWGEKGVFKKKETKYNVIKRQRGNYNRGIKGGGQNRGGKMAITNTNDHWKSILKPTTVETA